MLWMDNSICRLPISHYNFLLMQLWSWKMFGWLTTIKLLTWSFTIIIKDSFFIALFHHTFYYLIIGVSKKEHMTHFKMPSFLIFLEFMWDSSSLLICCRWSDIWTTGRVPQIFLCHFDVSFVQQLLLNVHYQEWLVIHYLLHI